jgi:hypothetical protein
MQKEYYKEVGMPIPIVVTEIATTVGKSALNAAISALGAAILSYCPVYQEKEEIIVLPPKKKGKKGAKKTKK